MRSKARRIEEAHATFLKVVLSVVCGVFLFFPMESFCGIGGHRGHLLYGFSHANVFHCVSNLLCLWLIRFRIRWLACYVLSVLASYLPCYVWDWGSLSFVVLPTCGLSGFLLCAVGMEWGRYRMFWKMVRYVGVPLAVVSFVPHVNGMLHFWCLGVGYLWGRGRERWGGLRQCRSKEDGRG